MKNIFKKKDFRQSGYYWVQYSYGQTLHDGVWRIAWYNHRLQVWTVDGETRTFHDMDFLEIDEQPIPRRWASFSQNIVLWVVNIILLITLITR